MPDETPFREPELPKIQREFTIDEIFPPEQQEKTKSFYQENKKTIHAIVAGVVILKVYKKKVAKTTAKAVVKTLAKNEGVLQPFARKTLPTMLEVLKDLRATPEMAYIPHGGGMVHLLGPSKDVIVTVFGNFEKMNNNEIFELAGRALGMRGY